jgi:isocitrate dehydrogenase
VFPDYLKDDQKEVDHAGRTRPAGDQTGSQHHQAAEHQRLGAAAQGRDQGTAGPGLQAAELSGRPTDDAEKDIKARYDKIKGSAVNPVLREGNSDRRAPLSVKNYARKHPHKMGAWSADSKSHVAHMDGGDFYGSEKSALIAAAGNGEDRTGSRRHDHGAEGKDRGQGRRDHRRGGDEPNALRSFLEAQDRRCEGQGRAVLAAPQGHHDEGVRSDHLRSWWCRCSTRTC